MSELIKSVNELPLGTAYAVELEKVECDPRIKKSIYRLANDLHEVGKRLNDTIEVVVAFNEALQAMAVEMGHIAAQGDALVRRGK